LAKEAVWVHRPAVPIKTGYEDDNKARNKTVNSGGGLSSSVGWPNRVTADWPRMGEQQPARFVKVLRGKQNRVA